MITNSRLISLRQDLSSKSYSRLYSIQGFQLFFGLWTLQLVFTQSFQHFKWLFVPLDIALILLSFSGLIRNTAIVLTGFIFSFLTLGHVLLFFENSSFYYGYYEPIFYIFLGFSVAKLGCHFVPNFLDFFSKTFSLVLFFLIPIYIFQAQILFLNISERNFLAIAALICIIFRLEIHRKENMMYAYSCIFFLLASQSKTAIIGLLVYFFVFKIRRIFNNIAIAIVALVSISFGVSVLLERFTRNLIERGESSLMSISQLDPTRWSYLELTKEIVSASSWVEILFGRGPTFDLMTLPSVQRFFDNDPWLWKFTIEFMGLGGLFSSGLHSGWAKIVLDYGLVGVLGLLFLLAAPGFSERFSTNERKFFVRNGLIFCIVPMITSVCVTSREIMCVLFIFYFGLYIQSNKKLKGTK